MKLHHLAIWTNRLEELKDFYVNYFNGKANEKYINPIKQFESYFVTFENDVAIELMTRVDVNSTKTDELLGYCHMAFRLNGKEEVLALTERFRKDGYTIAGEPRTTGDGMFESVVLDPDGNRIELVAV